MKRTVIAVVMLLLAVAGVADGATLWQSGTYAYDGQGNIRGIGSNVFYYDSVGRLKYGDAGTGRNQEYSYDDYGNLTSIRTDGGTAQSLAVDPATNRLKQTGGNIIGTHDAEGNLTEYLGGASSFAYDRLGSVTRSTVEGVQRIHIYTASDERIASITVNNAAPIRTEVTLRDPSARVLRRYATNGGLSATWSWEEDYVYRDSALLAAELPSSERRHFHPDHLGTPRLITDGAGNTVAVHAYYPFGEEATDPLQDTERSKFTGHERDAKTLDYMHARYYNARMGRFLSVDPVIDVKKALVEPQLWNRYAYVTNNPLRYRDPDGRFRDGYFEKPMTAENLAMDENTPTVVKASVYATGGLTALGAAEFLGAGSLIATAKEGLSAGGTWAVANWDKLQNFAQGVVDFFSPAGPTLGGFRAAESAIAKAEATGAKFGMSRDAIVSTTVKNGGRFVDQKNGTVNMFMARPDGKAGFVRVTIDATGKVLSVGLNQVRDIRDGLKSGRFLPF